MKGRFFFKEICLWFSSLDVVREHQMLFDLMKVNLGTWRAPDCVLQIPALKGNETAGTTTHFPHLCTLGFVDLEGCDAAIAFSVRSRMALRACSGEQLQSVCQSSLGTLQHWDHTQELMEPRQAFINQRNKCLCGFMQSKCVCDTWALTVGVLPPLHSFLLEETQTISTTNTAELGCKLQA